jgi:hypothetical protein
VDLAVEVYYSQVAEELDLEQHTNEESGDVRQVCHS